MYQKTNSTLAKLKTLKLKVKYRNIYNREVTKCIKNAAEIPKITITRDVYDFENSEIETNELVDKSWFRSGFGYKRFVFGCSRKKGSIKRIHRLPLHHKEAKVKNGYVTKSKANLSSRRQTIDKRKRKESKMPICAVEYTTSGMDNDVTTLPSQQLTPVTTIKRKSSYARIRIKRFPYIDKMAVLESRDFVCKAMMENSDNVSNLTVFNRNDCTLSEIEVEPNGNILDDTDDLLECCDESDGIHEHEVSYSCEPVQNEETLQKLDIDQNVDTDDLCNPIPLDNEPSDNPFVPCVDVGTPEFTQVAVPGTTYNSVPNGESRSCSPSNTNNFESPAVDSNTAMEPLIKTGSAERDNSKTDALSSLDNSDQIPAETTDAVMQIPDKRKPAEEVVCLSKSKLPSEAHTEKKAHPGLISDEEFSKEMLAVNGVTGKPTPKPRGRPPKKKKAKPNIGNGDILPDDLNCTESNAVEGKSSKTSKPKVGTKFSKSVPPTAADMETKQKAKHDSNLTPPKAANQRVTRHSPISANRNTELSSRVEAKGLSLKFINTNAKSPEKSKGASYQSFVIEKAILADEEKEEPKKTSPYIKIKAKRVEVLDSNEKRETDGSLKSNDNSVSDELTNNIENVNGLLAHGAPNQSNWPKEIDKTSKVKDSVVPSLLETKPSEKEEQATKKTTKQINFSSERSDKIVKSIISKIQAENALKSIAIKPRVTFDAFKLVTSNDSSSENATLANAAKHADLKETGVSISPKNTVSDNTKPQNEKPVPTVELPKRSERNIFEAIFTQNRENMTSEKPSNPIPPEVEQIKVKPDPDKQNDLLSGLALSDMDFFDLSSDNENDATPNSKSPLSKDSEQETNKAPVGKESTVNDVSDKNGTRDSHDTDPKDTTANFANAEKGLSNQLEENEDQNELTTEPNEAIHDHMRVLGEVRLKIEPKVETDDLPTEALFPESPTVNNHTTVDTLEQKEEAEVSKESKHEEKAEAEEQQPDIAEEVPFVEKILWGRCRPDISKTPTLECITHQEGNVTETNSACNEINDKTLCSDNQQEVDGVNIQLNNMEATTSKEDAASKPHDTPDLSAKEEHGSEKEDFLSQDKDKFAEKVILSKKERRNEFQSSEQLLAESEKERHERSNGNNSKQTKKPSSNSQPDLSKVEKEIDGELSPKDEEEKLVEASQCTSISKKATKVDEPEHDKFQNSVEEKPSRYKEDEKVSANQGDESLMTSKGKESNTEVEEPVNLQAVEDQAEKDSKDNTKEKKKEPIPTTSIFVDKEPENKVVSEEVLQEEKDSSLKPEETTTSVETITKAQDEVKDCSENESNQKEIGEKVDAKAISKNEEETKIAENPIIEPKQSPHKSKEFATDEEEKVQVNEARADTHKPDDTSAVNDTPKDTILDESHDDVTIQAKDKMVKKSTEDAKQNVKPQIENDVKLSTMPVVKVIKMRLEKRIAEKEAKERAHKSKLTEKTPSTTENEMKNEEVKVIDSSLKEESKKVGQNESIGKADTRQELLPSKGLEKIRRASPRNSKSPKSRSANQSPPRHNMPLRSRTTRAAQKRDSDSKPDVDAKRPNLSLNTDLKPNQTLRELLTPGDVVNKPEEKAKSVTPKAKPVTVRELIAEKESRKQMTKLTEQENKNEEIIQKQTIETKSVMLIENSNHVVTPDTINDMEVKMNSPPTVPVKEPATKLEQLSDTKPKQIIDTDVQANVKPPTQSTQLEPKLKPMKRHNYQMLNGRGLHDPELNMTLLVNPRNAQQKKTIDLSYLGFQIFEPPSETYMNANMYKPKPKRRKIDDSKFKSNRIVDSPRSLDSAMLARNHTPTAMVTKRRSSDVTMEKQTESPKSIENTTKEPAVNDSFLMLVNVASELRDKQRGDQSSDDQFTSPVTSQSAKTGAASIPMSSAPCPPTTSISTITRASVKPPFSSNIPANPGPHSQRPLFPPTITTNPLLSFMDKQALDKMMQNGLDPAAHHMLMYGRSANVTSSSIMTPFVTSAALAAAGLMTSPRPLFPPPYLNPNSNAPGGLSERMRLMRPPAPRMATQISPSTHPMPQRMPNVMRLPQALQTQMQHQRPLNLKNLPGQGNPLIGSNVINNSVNTQEQISLGAPKDYPMIPGMKSGKVPTGPGYSSFKLKPRARVPKGTINQYKKDCDASKQRKQNAVANHKLLTPSQQRFSSNTVRQNPVTVDLLRKPTIPASVAGTSIDLTAEEEPEGPMQENLAKKIETLIEDNVNNYDANTSLVTSTNTSTVLDTVHSQASSTALIPKRPNSAPISQALSMTTVPTKSHTMENSTVEDDEMEISALPNDTKDCTDDTVSEQNIPLTVREKSPAEVYAPDSPKIPENASQTDEEVMELSEESGKDEELTMEEPMEDTVSSDELVEEIFEKPDKNEVSLPSNHVTKEMTMTVLDQSPKIESVLNKNTPEIESVSNAKDVSKEKEDVSKAENKSVITSTSSEHPTSVVTSDTQVRISDFTTADSRREVNVTKDDDIEHHISDKTELAEENVQNSQSATVEKNNFDQDDTEISQNIDSTSSKKSNKDRKSKQLSRKLSNQILSFDTDKQLAQNISNSSFSPDSAERMRKDDNVSPDTTTNVTTPPNPQAPPLAINPAPIMKPPSRPASVTSRKSSMTSQEGDIKENKSRPKIKRALSNTSADTSVAPPPTIDLTTEINIENQSSDLLWEELLRRKSLSECVCGASFLSNVLFMLHRACHNTDEPHWCATCGQKSASWMEFYVHLHNHDK